MASTDGSAGIAIEGPRLAGEFLLVCTRLARPRSALMIIYVRGRSDLLAGPAVMIKRHDTMPADFDVTEVGRRSRQRNRQSPLERTAVQPKVNLHREPSIFNRCVQLA